MTHQDTDTIQYLKKFCYPDLSDSEILVRIKAANRHEEERRRFAKTIKFRSKCKNEKSK